MPSVDRRSIWPLAFRLVNLYPASVQLRRDLELRVEQMGQTISGPYSQHFQRCREDVEQALHLLGVIPGPSNCDSRAIERSRWRGS